MEGGKSSGAVWPEVQHHRDKGQGRPPGPLELHILGCSPADCPCLPALRCDLRAVTGDIVYVDSGLHCMGIALDSKTLERLHLAE